MVQDAKKIVKHENGMKRLSKDEYAEISNFLMECPGAWTRLHDALGIEEAFKLAHFNRDEIITRLRIGHGWTLQRIADILGLTRERIRQLTPPDLWGKKEEKEQRAWEDIKDEVLSLAIHSPDAWDNNGIFKKDWLKDRYENIEMPKRIYKFEAILEHGLDLKTREQKLEWISEQYYNLERTYSKIAEWLSNRFVYISTMNFYRSCRGLGFRGYTKGRRQDLTPPPFYSETSLRNEPL